MFVSFSDPDQQKEEEVFLESHRIHSLRRLGIHLHNRRLDELLKHNGMERVPVYPDGNCFFTAASFHLLNSDRTSLREELCFHIDENINYYKDFFPSSGDDEEERTQQVNASVEKLRQNGVWDSDGNDIVPLVLANYTGRRVKIFSSKLDKPVWDITPSLKTGMTTSVFCPIYLAFLSPRGQPAHFDGCLAKRRHIYTEFGDTCRSSNNHQEDHIQDVLGDEQEAAAADVGQSLTSRSPSSTETGQEDVRAASSPDTDSDGAPSSNVNIFITPPKKMRGRKRIACPEKWKRNIRKQLKLRGQQYKNSRGQNIEAKTPKVIDCTKCKLKCTDRISTEERQTVFQTFYSLENYERQKDYVCRHMEVKSTRTYLDDHGQPVMKKRNVERKFFFTILGQKVRVCKRFFQATLSAGQSYIEHALSNCSDGTFTGDDQRRKNESINKIPVIMRDRVRKHIESFPAVESHYCRKDTRRKFLDSTLNVNRMYKMYVDECENDDAAPVSCSLYRHIFNREYNLSFHHPKKDQCLVCNIYHDEKRRNTLTEEREAEYKEHMERKVEARTEKATDKKIAQDSDGMIHVATFDMEAVLPTPFDKTSQTYYKRKLSVYNLSVFALADKKATCYVWNESEGQRGSNEVGTCLYQHIQSLPQCVEHVILYSDTCGGQNRNQFITAALHHAAQNTPNIKTIDQNFFERGHSQMECDSMHACIERSRRGVRIHHPDQWITVMQCARDADPYTVVALEHDSFYDFKKLAKSTLRNVKLDIKNRRVNWLKIKWIRVTKADTDTIYFKYRMKE